MNEGNRLKILIGLLCVVLVLVVLVVAIALDGRPLEPIMGILQPQPTQEVTEPEQSHVENTTAATEPQQNQTQEEPPEIPQGGTTVEIPSVIEPGSSEPAVSFPCQIPGYDLVIEKLAAYQGMFVEDGSNAMVEDVAMLLIHNLSDAPVEYTQICVRYGQEELYFNISALPAGEKMVVQEKSGKPMPQGSASAAKALVIQGADMEMSAHKVRVVDNGDNTLTVENLTDKNIPIVRVFYKYYMEQEDIFVGGIAFTLRITQLAPGSSVTVQPAHFNSQSSRVVMVLTYDSEV